METDTRCLMEYTTDTINFDWVLAGDGSSPEYDYVRYYILRIFVFLFPPNAIEWQARQFI